MHQFLAHAGLANQDNKEQWLDAATDSSATYMALQVTKTKWVKSLGRRLTLKQCPSANYPLVFSQSSAIDKIKPHS